MKCRQMSDVGPFAKWGKRSKLAALGLVPDMPRKSTDTLMAQRGHGQWQHRIAPDLFRE
jgi:hypothetical protein